MKRSDPWVLSHIERRLIEQIVEDDSGVASAQFGFGLGDQAMGKRRRCQLLDVIGNDVIAPANGRQRLRRLEQRQAGARAGAQRKVAAAARGGDQPHDVIVQRLIDMHIPDLLLQRQQVVNGSNAAATG